MTLALRPQIVGIGPIAGELGGELGLSHAAVGLLSTVPILCMGLFAPFGPLVASAFGARPALTVTLAVIAGLGLLRVQIAAAPAFVIVTIGIGVATGIGGALPQIAAKLYSPDRSGLAGGSASAGIVAGAVLSGAAVVPLANALGGWREALAALAVLTLLTTLLGSAMLGPAPDAQVTAASATPMWQRPLAWIVALVFGSQAVVYWGAGAWLAASFTERGWDQALAGVLVGILNGSALAANLTVAAVSDRLGRRSRQIVGAALGVLAGCLGLAVLPTAALGWTVILGASLGAIFPLLLVYCLDVTHDPAAAGSLSAFMLLVGYTIAALGPVGLGFLRDLAGGFGITFVILTIVAGLLVILAVALDRWSEAAPA